ncbi:MAG: hypothetical protein JXX29_05525 [Deltaproteobacteria bacterium]|nr:hypothetical protein [Deltaproteobacteria bacterium]MBN2671109.1 hypothetical protein [Deltaproteobacteria bacterium]
MSHSKLFWIVLGLTLTLSLGLIAGCGGDDGDEPANTDADSDTDSDTDADSDTGSDTVPLIEVLNMTFEDGMGGGDKFYMSVPDSMNVPEDTDTTDDTDTAMVGPIYADNNTAVEIGGQNALMIHADSVEEDFGYAVEFQLQLDQPTDMSGEDFYVTFDVYVPQETYDYGANVQFALFETTNYTPVYSTWFDVAPEQWVSVSGWVSSTGDIDYTQFENNPGDWIFDVVRIKVICSGETAGADMEYKFYVDNVRVANKL